MDIERIKLALTQSRPDTDVERDEKRLPADVLHFFGIEQGHKIGEMNSGRGYLSAITNAFSIR